MCNVPSDRRCTRRASFEMSKLQGQFPTKRLIRATKQNPFIALRRKIRCNPTLLKTRHCIPAPNVLQPANPMKLLLLACLVATLSLGCALAKADVVTEWNTLLLDAIRNESTSPPLAARNLAILHASIY